jgi:predicted transcriptional regulator
MNKTRFSKAETRILEQYWKLGISAVREILDSLPEEERVAYTTVQTLVYRLEQKGALRKVKKIGNASSPQSTRTNTEAGWFETFWIYSADPLAYWFRIYSKPAPSRRKT